MSFIEEPNTSRAWIELLYLKDLEALSLKNRYRYRYIYPVLPEQNSLKGYLIHFVIIFLRIRKTETWILISHTLFNPLHLTSTADNPLSNNYLVKMNY